MQAVQRLRSATADDHDRVDAAFGGFDLAARGDYARFLTAHAIALPAVEVALAGIMGLPPLRGRTAALSADLAALDHAMPDPLSVSPPPTLAAAFGAAYVIEGSRLGGGLLARRVPASWPAAYLGDVHQPGEWRGFMTALDDAAAGDEAWIEEALASARATFALYGQAAARV